MVDVSGLVLLTLLGVIAVLLWRILQILVRREKALARRRTEDKE